MCIPYLFIDASTDVYEEEEAYEEEEEHFDNCTNQGKLILVQASKDILQFIYLGNLSHSKFYFAKLHFSQSNFYSSPLSESITTTRVSRFSLATHFR